MTRYIKKQPDTIEAIQWFKHGDHPKVIRSLNTPSVGWLKTRIGDKIIYPGDYIITDGSGEYYHWNTENFEATFEKVGTIKVRSKKAKSTRIHLPMNPTNDPC